MRKNREASEKDVPKSEDDVNRVGRDDIKQTSKGKKKAPLPPATGHLPSFSSLFTSNPDIPSVKMWVL